MPKDQATDVPAIDNVPDGKPEQMPKPAEPAANALPVGPGLDDLLRNMSIVVNEPSGEEVHVSASPGGGYGTLASPGGTGVAVKPEEAGPYATRAYIKYKNTPYPGHENLTEPPVGDFIQVPDSNITNNNGSHEWHTGPLVVKNDGDKINKLWARVGWQRPPTGFPPTYPPIIEEKDETVYTVIVDENKGFDKASSQKSLSVTDVIPTSSSGDWLFYKEIPANLKGLGARLMLEEHIPLRTERMGIAANVDWEYNSDGAKAFGVRRPQGSHLFPAPAGFPFEQIAMYALIVGQGNIPNPNPFVVFSVTRSIPDTVVLNPRFDVYVRLNIPDALHDAIKGSYSLWINPYIDA